MNKIEPPYIVPHSPKWGADGTLHHTTKAGSNDWRTPQAFFDTLHAEFEFEIDAAASPENAMLPRYWTEGDDALAQDWTKFGSVWVNPPYGRGIEKWMQKAWESSRIATTVCLLTFVRTDTKWWADWAWKAADWRLVQGRLTFEPPNGYAGKPMTSPVPSVLFVFDPLGGRWPRVIPISRGGSRLIANGSAAP